MSTSVANLGRGNYVLGGLGAVSGESASEAIDLAQQQELNTRSKVQEMAHARAMEGRVQQQFVDQQADRADTLAQKAKKRAANKTLMDAWGGVNGVPRPAAPLNTITPAPPPGTGVPQAGLAIPTGTAPTEAVPSQTAVPQAGLRNGGVQVASANAQDAFRLAMAANPEAFSGVPNQGPKADGFASVNPNATPFIQDVQGVKRWYQVNEGISNIIQGLHLGRYGPNMTDLGSVAGYFTDTPGDVEKRQVLQEAINWFKNSDNINFLRENPNLIKEASKDPVSFIARQVATQQTGVEPSSAKAATAEHPKTAKEAAPVKKKASGGLQTDYGTPVEKVFSRTSVTRNVKGKTKTEPSDYYVSAPERIFQDAQDVSQKQKRLGLLSDYYRKIGDIQGLVGVTNQLDALTLEQRYLRGMTAIVGIQQQNFGPMQELLRERFPGRQVEVRPYTDKTVEVFLDGQPELRLSWDDVSKNLRDSYDRGYIAQQQALTKEIADRSRFVFEERVKQEFKISSELAVLRAQQDIDKLEEKGKIERLGETINGEVVWQSVKDGTATPFVYREVQQRSPETGEMTVHLVAKPVDQTLVK